MCGQSGPLCHPLQPHTFTQLTFTAQVYIRPCPHTPTPVRPPRLEGNHEKATLCSQTAQCDRSGAPLTPMQQPLPTERSVCALLCICQSALLHSQMHRKVLTLFVAVCQPQRLIPMSNSSPKSRRFTRTKRWRVSMSAFNRSSISGIIALMGAGWEAWLVKVLTFILCVCGCNGLVRTGHVIAWALFYPSL